jgi:RPE1 domain-containing protein/outer membrane autotransporter protein
MVLFYKLQNILINRYLVTRYIIFLFLFILFFLLQGFGTSNVLAAGVNNVENGLEEIQQTINKAYGELERLKQEYNSHTVNYSEEVELLEDKYLKSLDLMTQYKFKREKIRDEISYNKTLQGIKKKGLTEIENLIDRNYEEYDKAQSEDERNTLAEKEKFLLTIKKELEETPYQDAVYLKNENNKQGGSEYNVVNTDPEIYEDNFSEHSSIVEILKKINISPQDLGYDDNKKETLDTKLNEVNKKLKDTQQYIDKIEKKEMPLLLQEKNNHDQLSSSIKLQQDKIKALLKIKKDLESKVYIQQQTPTSLVTARPSNISLNDPPPDPSLRMQTEILAYQVDDSVVTPPILDTLNLVQPNNRLLSKLAYTEGFEGDAERRTAAYSNVREDSSTASTYKSLAEVEFRKRSNKTLTDKAIPQVNTKSLHDEFQGFPTKNDDNNQRRHSIETEQPKRYQDKKTITRTFSLELPRPQSLDEGFFSHHSTPESEKEEWNDSEDESLIDTPLKRFSRSSSLAPLDPQYYSRRSSDASNLDSSDKVAVVTFPPLPITQETMSIVTESQSLVKTTPPVTIVNSGELDSRNDGAKPIDNRRTIEDDVTKFSSIDYNLQYPVETIYLNDLENGDNKQGVSKNNLELHEYENPPKPYKTKRQKRSIAVHDNADVVQNEVFNEDNLGLKELFKEEAVPIVADVQLPEAEHHADEQLVANEQLPEAEHHADEQLVADVQLPEAEHHADEQLVADVQLPEAEHHADEQFVADVQLPEAEHHADEQFVADVQLPEAEHHADEQLVADVQLPEAEHHVDEQLVADVQPLATAAEPQVSAETTILAEKESYIPPINFDIEQNIVKYTTYIEFDYLDLISNTLSTRNQNNLLTDNPTVKAAGDNDYYIKKGGWIQVMRSISKQKGNTLPFKNNQQGFFLGFDAQPLDELIIGIAYANANSYTKFQSIFNDKQNTILHVAAIYSKYTLLPNMYLSSYLKYGKAFIKNLGERDTISINSKTNGYVGRAKLETHYKVDLDKFLFKPMVGIIFDRFLIKNFTEYRKDFNINVPTRQGKRISFETGIDFSKRILVKNISIIPKVHFKLDQTILLNNSTDIINFTSIEHHTQTVAITKSLRPSPKNVMYTLGGCINMQSVSALELGAGYDYSLKKSFTTHSFYVNGSVKF